MAKNRKGVRDPYFAENIYARPYGTGAEEDRLLTREKVDAIPTADKLMTGAALPLAVAGGSAAARIPGAIRSLLTGRNAAQAARTGAKYADDVSEALGAAKTAQGTGARVAQTARGLRPSRKAVVRGGGLLGVLGLGGLIGNEVASQHARDGANDRFRDKRDETTATAGPTSPSQFIGNEGPYFPAYGAIEGFGKEQALTFGNKDLDAAMKQPNRLVSQGADPTSYNAGANYSLGVDPREAAKLALPPSRRYLEEVAGAQARNAGTFARTQRYSASDFGAPDVDELNRRLANLRPEEREGTQGKLLAAQIGAIGAPKNPNEGRGGRGDSNGLRDLLAADRNNIQRERLAYEMQRDDANREGQADRQFEDNLMELRKNLDPQDFGAAIALQARELMASGDTGLTSERGRALRRQLKYAGLGRQERDMFQSDYDGNRSNLADDDFSTFGGRSSFGQIVGDGNAAFYMKDEDPFYMNLPSDLRDIFSQLADFDRSAKRGR